MAAPTTRVVNVNGRNRRPWALQSRENLLNAAIEEIARTGFDKARLVDIAKRADMTAGSIYTWFENKEDLFRAALEKALSDQLASNLEAIKELPAPHHGNWMAQTAILVPRNSSDTGDTNMQRLLIESFYASWRDPNAAKTLLPRLKEHVNTYVRIITEAQEKGEIRQDINAHALAMLLVSVPLGLSLTTLAGIDRVEDSAWLSLMTAAYYMAKPD